MLTSRHHLFMFAGATGEQRMNESTSLNQYLKDNYEKSVFDLALNDSSPWVYHLHGREIVHARLVRSFKYGIVLSIDTQPEREIEKTSIKLLYPVAYAQTAGKLLKSDPKVQARRIEPIISPKDRNHIKNKTLFPLMQQRAVLFFTLLEGEIIRGLVLAFSRYDLTIGLKGGIPITVLRHSILDVRDKKGQCYLKSKS
jgi:hypothetical protein